MTKIPLVSAVLFVIAALLVGAAFQHFTSTSFSVNNVTAVRIGISNVEMNDIVVSVDDSVTGVLMARRAPNLESAWCVKGDRHNDDFVLSSITTAYNVVATNDSVKFYCLPGTLGAVHSHLKHCQFSLGDIAVQGYREKMGEDFFGMVCGDGYLYMAYSGVNDGFLQISRVAIEKFK